MGTYAENMSFEAEARRIAEILWNLQPGECQPMHYAGDPVVREIDGIARLRDVTHLLMVTTSTRLDKTKDQIKKLAAAEGLERKNAPAVSKWIITERQLDAEHIDLARRSGVIALTLAQFQQRFFDGKEYIALRSRHVFGSARDPRTDSVTIADGAYVPLPLRIVIDRVDSANVGRITSLEEIAARLSKGEVVVLRAPFGSGKSLTTRELFQRLAVQHQRSANEQVPLCLNLREHWGEAYSDEMLDRHARAIGYRRRDDVVVAWRAGMCSLLLDGFDEVASQAVGRLENKNFMREARRQALRGVRDFTSKIPSGVGVFLCGRNHYFDDSTEMFSSLGLTSPRVTVVDLGEFDESNAIEFLRRNGVTYDLPDWLPRKPLILSYLLRESLFEKIISIDGSKGFGFAWDSFLTLICQREAALDQSVMDPDTVRSVLERLSQLVRSKVSGTGPITGTELANAYASETKQAAGEGVLAQLQRLPGLTQRESEAEARSFVDPDMLAALQGSAFAKNLLSGGNDTPWNALEGLSDKAIDMATYMLSKSGVTSDTVVGTMARALHNIPSDRAPAQYIADCLAVAVRLAIFAEEPALDFRSLLVSGASIQRVPLDEISLRGVTFQDCSVGEVGFGDSNVQQVRFENCLIVRVVGASNREGIPPGVISDDTEVSSFDNMSTNNAVLSSNAPPQLKALLTVLRKLYKQAGGGRKVAAFTRGITKPEVARYIEAVIDLLKRHQFISIFNAVVHPVRKQAGRVEGILAAPNLSTDPLVLEVKALK